MSTLAEVFYDEQSRSTEYAPRAQARDWAFDMAMAVLIAGSVLLLPALAAAAAPEAKPEPAHVASSSAGNRKVSPYTIASRRHMEELAASGERPMKRPLGQPMHMQPVRSGK